MRYAENGDSKYERAAMKYLRRYMDEANPSLADRHASDAKAP
jgi:hypothetical protein